jgi:hypothetical protein
VSATRRLCQARLRQAGQQYVAEAGRSTPTVHDALHSGQLDFTPAWIASVLARARRMRRQCLARHTDEQNYGWQPHPPLACRPFLTAEQVATERRDTR